MNTLKEEFLKIKTFEEYQRRKKEFEGLKDDAEIIKHFNSLLIPDEPRMPGIFTEVYPKKDINKR